MPSLTDPKPLTADYMPHAGGDQWSYWLASRPPFNPLAQVPKMLADPRIVFGLWLLKGPILSRARFFIKSPDARYKQWLVNNITKFWRTSAMIALKAIEWGWSGSEAMYRHGKDGLIDFDKLVSLGSADVKPRTVDGRLVAMAVQGVPGKHRVRLGGPKGLWHVHGREHNPWFGRSRLYGSYPAHLMRWTEKGLNDSIRLYMHKYAYDGGEVYYPPNWTMPDPDNPDKILTGKEMARDAVEKQATGGTLYWPNIQGPAGDGKPAFYRIPPVITAMPENIMELLRDVKDEEWEGMGIPPEVARAEGTGAYAGRRVPMQAFYASLQELVMCLVSDLDEQLLRPVGKMNFGQVADYEIIPFPLSQPLPGEEGDQGAQQGSLDQENLAREPRFAQPPRLSEPARAYAAGGYARPPERDAHLDDPAIRLAQQAGVETNGLCYWSAA